MELQEILGFAEERRACSSQLNKFKEFIQAGDELQAWQTVLGNIGWLRTKGLIIDQTEVETKAKGVGIMLYENGQLRERANFKDGNKNGLCEWWHENGQIAERINYKDGKRDGLHEWWDVYGNLIKSEIY